MPIDHPHYRQVLLDACKELKGEEYCSDIVVQGIAAVSMSETGYGTFKPFMREAKDDEPAWYSHNYGAMQCGKRAEMGKCPDDCFPAKDSSPVTGEYTACFQVFPTEKDGALAFVKLLTVQRRGIAEVLPTGETWLLSKAMYDARYYEGHGKTKIDRIRNHAKAIQRNANGVAVKNQEPALWMLQEPPTPVTEQMGMGAIGGVAVTLAVVAITKHLQDEL